MNSDYIKRSHKKFSYDQKFFIEVKLQLSIMVFRSLNERCACDNPLCIHPQVTLSNTELTMSSKLRDAVYAYFSWIKELRKAPKASLIVSL